MGLRRVLAWFFLVLFILLIPTIGAMDDTKMNQSEIVSSTEVLRTVLLLPPASFFHRLDFVYSAWTGTDDKYDSKRFKINGKHVFLFPDEVPDGPGTDIGAVDVAQEVIPSHEHAAKTGTSLWDCSIVLSKFIEEMTLKNVVEAKRERYGVSGKKVIELVGCSLFLFFEDLG